MNEVTEKRIRLVLMGPLFGCSSLTESQCWYYRTQAGIEVGKCMNDKGECMNDKSACRD
jgi:hypothetical protein